MSELQRHLPLAKVNAIYDRDSSIYPDTVRPTMDDGMVVTYHREEKQPKPYLREALDKYTKTCTGYKRKHCKKMGGV